MPCTGRTRLNKRIKYSEFLSIRTRHFSYRCFRFFCYRPNARGISFHKTGSVGIQVAGGNAVGIFVAAIRPDSAAAKEGLKTGDQIIMVSSNFQ